MLSNGKLFMKFLIIVFFFDCFFSKKGFIILRLELAFIFRAFYETAHGQKEVYFREIIFLQNFSELSISLLPEKKKLDSAYKLFKLAPGLTIANVTIADIQQCHRMYQSKSCS